MSTIKVLPLPDWAMAPRRDAPYLQQSPIGGLSRPPVFHRPGVYLHGPYCWLELPDGTAASYSLTSFLYELRLYRASELNAKQAAALEAVVAARMATRQQQQLLDDYKEAQYLRNLYRSGKHVYYRFLLSRGKAPHFERKHNV